MNSECSVIATLLTMFFVSCVSRPQQEHPRLHHVASQHLHAGDVPEADDKCVWHYVCLCCVANDRRRIRGECR